jgi:YD repeat-containing protein
LYPPFVADLNGDGRDEVVLLPDPGASPQVSSLIALTTEVATAPLGVQHEFALASSVSPNFKEAAVGDFDGDGRVDIVAPDNVKGTYEIFSFSNVFLTDPPDTYAYLDEPYAPGQNSPLFAVDLDGDGLPDLVKGERAEPDWSKSNWWYRLSQGNWAFAPKIAAGTAGSPLRDWTNTYNYALAYDDGHRRATIFPASPLPTDPPATDDAGAPAPVVPWGFRVDSAGVVYPQPNWSDPGGKVLRAMADLDGDGIRQWYTLRMTESGSVTSHFPALLCPGDATTGCWQIDWLTADQLADIFTTGAVGDHSGDTWRLQVADLDADGRDDIVVTYLPAGWPDAVQDPKSRPLVRVFGSVNHEQPASPGDYSSPFKASLVAPPDAFGDFDGDGKVDYAAYDRLIGHWRVFRQTGIGHIDRIVSVADEGDESPGHAREKVTYSTSWSPQPEPGTCAHPQRCMRQGFTVVREHDVYQGRDTLGDTLAPGGVDPQYQRHLYNYEDPRYDVHGRGFLGFGTVRHWDAARLAETITTYDHETSVNGYYPYAMRPKRTRAAVALKESHARILQTDYTYEVRQLNGGKTHAVFPSTWSSMEWEELVDVDLDGGAKVHITHIDGPEGERQDLRMRAGSASYDDYGNVLETFAGTIGGDTTHVISTYEIRKTVWLVGLLKTQETASGDFFSYPPPAPRHVEYDYEGRGLLCHTYIERNHPNIEIPEVLTHFHDADGLTIAVTATAVGEPARTTHTAYEPNDRVYPARVWNDLGHAQAFLHDPGFGVLLAQADENGVQTHWGYDTLGRVVAIARDGEAKVSVKYSQRLTQGMEVVGMNVETADETGASSLISRDELGRVIRRSHIGFDGSKIIQDVRYDVLGRVISVTRPGVGAPSNVATTYEYDKLDRLQREVRPNSEIITHDHTFFSTRTIDPMLHERELTRDLARGRGRRGGPGGPGHDIVPVRRVRAARQGNGRAGQ